MTKAERKESLMPKGIPRWIRVHDNGGESFDRYICVYTPVRTSRKGGRIYMKYQYYTNCVNWPRADVFREGGLSDMIDNAIDISRRTFLKHVDRGRLEALEMMLGYENHPRRGLTMAGDYHVSYHRSKLHGKRVYYFRHSAIEYVFTERGHDNG
jgi:hypothetical protein